MVAEFTSTCSWEFAYFFVNRIRICAPKPAAPRHPRFFRESSSAVPSTACTKKEYPSRANPDRTAPRQPFRHKPLAANPHRKHSHALQIQRHRHRRMPIRIRHTRIPIPQRVLHPKPRDRQLRRPIHHRQLHHLPRRRILRHPSPRRRVRRRRIHRSRRHRRTRLPRIRRCKIRPRRSIPKHHRTGDIQPRRHAHGQHHNQPNQNPRLSSSAMPPHPFPALHMKPFSEAHNLDVANSNSNNPPKNANPTLYSLHKHNLS